MKMKNEKRKRDEESDVGLKHACLKKRKLGGRQIVFQKKKSKRHWGCSIIFEGSTVMFTQC